MNIRELNAEELRMRKHAYYDFASSLDWFVIDDIAYCYSRKFAMIHKILGWYPLRTLRNPVLDDNVQAAINTFGTGYADLSLVEFIHTMGIG